MSGTVCTADAPPAEAGARSRRPASRSPRAGWPRSAGCRFGGRFRDLVELSVADPARVLLLGGEPFAEPILMWWNFVARTREEIITAAHQWRSEDPRFGRVDSPLPRLRLPPLPWPRTP